MYNLLVMDKHLLLTGIVQALSGNIESYFVFVRTTGIDTEVSLVHIDKFTQFNS